MFVEEAAVIWLFLALIVNFAFSERVFQVSKRMGRLSWRQKTLVLQTASATKWISLNARERDSESYRFVATYAFTYILSLLSLHLTPITICSKWVPWLLINIWSSGFTSRLVSRSLLLLNKSWLQHLLFDWRKRDVYGLHCQWLLFLKSFDWVFILQLINSGRKSEYIRCVNCHFCC